MVKARTMTYGAFLTGLLLAAPLASRAGDLERDGLPLRDHGAAEEVFRDSRPPDVVQGIDPLLTDRDFLTPRPSQQKGVDNKRREPFEMKGKFE
jgi:hypothetical protein